MNLDELKSELTEKEGGCGKEMEYIEGETRVIETCGTFNYCPTCQAKIEYLKKGISACEEILNNQPQIRCRGVTNHYEGMVKPSESGGQTLFKEMSHYKSRCVDLMCENDELKQALSQRNQEILEIIEPIIKHNVRPDIWTIDIIISSILEELKQQLTNSEGKDV